MGTANELHEETKDTNAGLNSKRPLKSNRQNLFEWAGMIGLALFVCVMFWWGLIEIITWFF